MKSLRKRFAIVAAMASLFTVMMAQTVFAVSDFQSKVDSSNKKGSSGIFGGIVDGIVDLSVEIGNAGKIIILAVSVIMIFIALFKILFSGQRGIEQGKSTFFIIVLVIAIAILAFDIVLWVANAIQNAADEGKEKALIDAVRFLAQR